MSEQHYSEAIEMLQPAIVALQSDAKQLILALVKKLHCLMMMKQNEAAQSISDVIIAIVKKENFGGEIEKYCNEIEQVIIKAEDNQQPKLASSLLRALMYVTSCCPHKISKLQKFVDVGWLMTCIAIKSQKRNIQLNFQPIMDDCLDTMQSTVVSDLNDVKKKVELIAWFLKHYGYCCNETRRCNEAVIHYERAIFLMKSVFGEEANCYRVFGKCHLALGLSYFNLNQLNKSKCLFEQALEHFKHARDWRDYQENSEFISATSCNLRLVETKLAPANTCLL